MDPAQDPETLELFKADLARRLFDSSVPAWQLESDRAVIELVEDGLVLMRKTDKGWECQLTEAGESFT
jgi:hypothetical protein